MIGAATLLPTIIGGIVLSAAAFTITTGDSYLLSAAANFCIDLYSKINPNATEKEELKVSRAFILIAGIVAYVILTFFPSILAIQYWSYTIYGAGITPAVVGALIWKKATKAGGISSMIVGCVDPVSFRSQWNQPGALRGRRGGWCRPLAQNVAHYAAGHSADDFDSAVDESRFAACRRSGKSISDAE